MTDQVKDGIIGNNHGIKNAGKPYIPLIEKMAIRYGIPEVLISHQMNQESGYNPTLVSSAGAVGIMQIMPKTALALSGRYDIPAGPLEDPDINAQLGVQYMRELFDYAYKNIVRDRRNAYELALAGYFAGPARMSKIYEGAPMTPGEKRYVANIIWDFEDTEKWSQLKLPDAALKKVKFPWAALLIIIGGLWLIEKTK
jgi:soluble lytic murein transglycosylase-like protein